MKSKIVLFDSNVHYVGVPLALLSITKLLDTNKYDIHIVTRTEYPDYEREILKQCEDAICFGVTCITGTPIKTALKISETVKNKYPTLPIIWGGWQAITLPDLTLENPNIDYLCTGQGERTFYEFINMIDKKDFKNITTITGLSCKINGKITHAARRNTEDLNQFPDFDLKLVNWEKYLEVTDYGKKALRIVTSYGCAYRCAFCCEPFNTKRKWKALSSERILQFLQNLYKVVSFDSLVIVDSNFFTNEQRVVEFCEGLIRNNFNIKFGQVNGRTNELIRYKETTWELLRKAGLYQILIGAESASNETLKLIDKDATVENTVLTGKICKKYDIKLVVSAILGLPIASYFGNDQNSAFEKEFSELYGFYKGLYNDESRTHLLAFVYTPLPSSPMYDKAIQLGFSPPRNLDEWSNYELTDIHINWISRNKVTKVFMLNYMSMLLSMDFSHLFGSLPCLVRIFIVPIISFSRYICKLRLIFNMFYFPIDMWLFFGGIVVFKKMNRVLKMVNIG